MFIRDLIPVVQICSCTELQSPAGQVPVIEDITVEVQPSRITSGPYIANPSGPFCFRSLDHVSIVGPGSGQVNRTGNLARDRQIYNNCTFEESRKNAG